MPVVSGLILAASKVPHYLRILEMVLSPKGRKRRTATIAALPVFSNSVGAKNTFMTTPTQILNTTVTIVSGINSDFDCAM